MLHKLTLYIYRTKSRQLLKSHFILFIYEFYSQRARRNGHECLVCANDLVIFSNSLYLNVAIDSLNSAHGPLHNLLSMSFFSVAPKKCKALVFTRKCYNYCLEIVTNGIVIPVFSNIMYLRRTLDSKLRWTPRLHNLTKFISQRWNVLRLIANS